MDFRLNQFKSRAFNFVPRLDLKDVAKKDLDAQVGDQDKHVVPLHNHEHLLGEFEKRERVRKINILFYKGRSKKKSLLGKNYFKNKKNDSKKRLFSRLEC